MSYKVFDGATDMVEYEDAHDATRGVMKTLLARRALFKKQDINNFLYPSYELWVKDPFGIKGMEEGARRIVEALRANETICVYSDYDCDGIPGGAVLSDFFEHIGYVNRIHYIPHRHKEGYGLNTKAIDSLKKDGVSLIITVDNGITHLEEVLYGKSLGIDVIVTDHHLPLSEEGKQLLPDGYVVINSKRDDCTYHDDMLCGAAVAWKLVCAVLSLLRKHAEEDKKGSKKWKTILEKIRATKVGYEKWWLDLVAIATIADMVPLQKENRALAYYGLHVLRKSGRPGLQKLLALSKTKQAHLNAQDISFTIAPRVNAASRMADPRLAFRMLRNGNDIEARTAAEEIESLNTARKQSVKEIKHEVFGYDLDSHTHVVVIGNSAWSPGILGLIAQEVLEETGKVSFVWGKGETDADGNYEYKGSCRAPEGINLVDLMSACPPGTFLGFGGHALSGGFSVAPENIDTLPETLNTTYEGLGCARSEEESVETIDAHITFDDVTKALHKELMLFEPCGEGNPKPLFAFASDGALSVREFGKAGGHFEVLYPKTSGDTVKAIYFFGDKNKLALANRKHTLIATIEESHFGYRPELRLRVLDIVSSLI